MHYCAETVGQVTWCDMLRRTCQLYANCAEDMWWVSLVLSCPLLQFPMGPGSDGPLGAMAGMEPHHMNGSLGNTTNSHQHHAQWAHSETYTFLMTIQHKCFSTAFHIVSFLGSGDMDGMNKVNVITTQRIVLAGGKSEMVYILKKTVHALFPEFPK